MQAKDFKMPKFRFVFGDDRLKIEQGDNKTDYVLYKSMQCVSMMGQSSFFFRSGNMIYMLYFKNTEPANAVKWYTVVLAYIEMSSDEKNGIQVVDIGENFGIASWDDKIVEYTFNYKVEAADKKDLTSGFNDGMEAIWI